MTYSKPSVEFNRYFHIPLSIVTKHKLGLPFPARNLSIKFDTNPSTIFLVIVVTDRHTDTQTNAGKTYSHAFAGKMNERYPVLKVPNMLSCAYLKTGGFWTSRRDSVIRWYSDVATIITLGWVQQMRCMNWCAVCRIHATDQRWSSAVPDFASLAYLFSLLQACSACW